jgi:hypothetical protein
MMIDDLARQLSQSLPLLSPSIFCHLGNPHREHDFWYKVTFEISSPIFIFHFPVH